MKGSTLKHFHVPEDIQNITEKIFEILLYKIY